MSGFMGELAGAVFDADPRYRFASEPGTEHADAPRSGAAGFTDLGVRRHAPDRRICALRRGRCPADVPTPYAPDAVASRT